MTTSMLEPTQAVTGEFITLGDERFYAIHNADQMAPFFISLVSDSDHWLFAASNGGLTAGRVSPETALFPYESVDKIYDSTAQTGSKTLLRVEKSGQRYHWEPFNREHDDRYAIQRNLYKNTLGNKLCFEEVNQTLQLTFRYIWMTSDSHGFVRHCELLNQADETVSVELLDGLQNILPAGTPRYTQTNSSNLVDAYKWAELDETSGLALFTLFSGITDRAEPCESLRANTLFCLGLESCKVLLSNEQLKAFRQQQPIVQERHKRGIRGAFMVHSAFKLNAQQQQAWQLVANLEQNQSQISALLEQLKKPEQVKQQLDRSVAQGSDALARIMASADGFQATQEENVSVHHYANVLFNVLRGGIFDTQYQINSADFRHTLKTFNRHTYERHQQLLEALPETIHFSELQKRLGQTQDAQLQRLVMEYLPITFGRRHGDPSRPWNQFAIKLKDEQGNRLLSYQGNWRDIFQNWEALSFSYPEFIESIITKFVNASTLDGYNPYRITKEGIDWEVEEPDDPWSYIGYWGDHQIIYLLKLLEQSKQFHPQTLSTLLQQEIFSYANVPYKIKPFAELVKNAKDTVSYDHALAELIERRVANMGADGKLLLDDQQQVYQVNLLEKLLVPLLSKLSNLVIDGGIWLNTQRPEWNDANNALVGQGLSMVTLYYMRRYIRFLQELLASQSDSSQISCEVVEWLRQTATILADARQQLTESKIPDTVRYQILKQLGEAGAHYRQTLYQAGCFSGKKTLERITIQAMLEDAQAAVDHSISANQTSQGLYHAYNLLEFKAEQTQVDHLYVMLEGQVAALSSGAIAPAQAANVLETLFDSAIYRADQKTFMLYPDRSLPSFMAKNTIPAEQLAQQPLLQQMIAKGDTRLIEQDSQGLVRFHADLTNVGALLGKIHKLEADYPELAQQQQQLAELYEQTFLHKEFTGRSGGMFGFEGLGCIYWHMISKLLLAAQENFYLAIEQAEPAQTVERLAALYYRIREGIGFNKTPQEYGAFPTDPYSHTPKHAGAQQPGMTGQVKEEVLTRFGELGLRVRNGQVHFQPHLLRGCEFLETSQSLNYLDVTGTWQSLKVAPGELAYTWAQVPICYRLTNQAHASVTLYESNGHSETQSKLSLSPEISQELFQRSGKVKMIVVAITAEMLLD